MAARVWGVRAGAAGLVPRRCGCVEGWALQKRVLNYRFGGGGYVLIVNSYSYPGATASPPVRQTAHYLAHICQIITLL